MYIILDYKTTDSLDLIKRYIILTSEVCYEYVFRIYLHFVSIYSYFLLSGLLLG